jgi:hypothetical protein
MDLVLTDWSPIQAWAVRDTLRPYGIVVDYPCIAGMRSRDAIAMRFAENGVPEAEPGYAAAVKTNPAARRIREGVALRGTEIVHGRARRSGGLSLMVSDVIR